MRILVACEFSGIVRDAFRDLGHDAVSCDLLPTERPGPHIQGNIISLLDRGWDLMLAFPPCTYLCSSGARWWKDRMVEQAAAIEFVAALSRSPIPRWAIENPIGRLSTVWRKPDQIIQPWQFGHGEVKATCLWLKGLPKLEPTEIVSGRIPRVHHHPQTKGRAKSRSRFLPGIAAAMTAQWGNCKEIG